MAQKVNIVLVDDLDGSEAAETVTFGLDGTSYEIDLNEGNASALREVLAGYVGHARKVSGGGSRRTSSSRRSSSSSTNGSASNTRAVREWAKENGYEVSERGRISADVQQAYDAAN
jgi:Lsr2